MLAIHVLILLAQMLVYNLVAVIYAKIQVVEVVVKDQAVLEDVNLTVIRYAQMHVVETVLHLRVVVTVDNLLLVRCFVDYLVVVVVVMVVLDLVVVHHAQQFVYLLV